MQEVLYVALGLFVGALAALRFIAPRTATDKDDKILAAAEKLEPVVDMLAPKPPAK